MIFKYILSSFLLMVLSYTTHAQEYTDSIKVDNFAKNNALHYTIYLSNPDSVKTTVINRWREVITSHNQWYEAGKHEVSIPFIQPTGTYVLTIKIKSGKEYAGALTNINSTTPVMEEIISPKIIAYPNPFSEKITIQNCQNCTIILINQNGTRLPLTANGIHSTEFNTSFLPAGMYFLEISRGQKRELFQMVK